jgi:hypothetical protein
MSSVKSALILLPFLTGTLHESNTRKALLGPWLNNTEGYLTPSLVLKFTQMQDNITSIYYIHKALFHYIHNVLITQITVMFYTFSQTCILQLHLYLRKNDSIRQVTAYLRSVYQDCLFRSVKIYVLLLLERNLLKNIAVVLLWSPLHALVL